MKRIIATTSILALTGTAALAGGYTAPQPAPEVAPAPVMTAPANFNWSGFYGGAQIGYGNADGAISGDGAVGGVHLGYLNDFGNFVAGGELAYSGADVKDDATGDRVKNMTDLKFIGGVPYQDMLFYGALGASHMKAEIGGASYTDTVPMVGLGMKKAIGNNWSVGGELDYRKGNDFDSTGSDLDTTTLNLTASYKF
ncbi:outer membrane protein [Thioclava atlantica]|uniref:Outer membrane protein n=1 Tax=Thioclava atlantica TaxID=1317124 RepID=A0A085TVZ3_9RHOB|nr:outer membrane beta-barrel protein [Thioclava atlantica]KFE34890.1 outer membrane protein [Thioclava atlantica]